MLQERKILTLVIGNTLCQIFCSTFANSRHELSSPLPMIIGARAVTRIYVVLAAIYKSDTMRLAGAQQKKRK